MLWVWSMSHFMPLISWFGALSPKHLRGGKRKSAETLLFKGEVPVALSTLGFALPILLRHQQETQKETMHLKIFK